ncbi:MAG: hypothetical protein L3J34_07030 [Flavobacteriaceae bacterium]|nr:hypothetical protein [Flavobacteriaceae bacterium]
MHNVIPHDHHDDITEINHHSPSHKNGKHHHHHDNKEKDHHDENDEPIDLFSHSTYIFAFTEFVFSTDNSMQKTCSVNPFFQITDLVFKPTVVSIKQKPPNYIYVVPLQLFYSTHTLRGPPAIAV